MTSTSAVFRHPRAARPQRHTRRLSRRYAGHRSAKQYTGHATVGEAFLDPFIGGSYSVWLVGQLTAFGDCEGRAEGPIHFAGEHTSFTEQGYMEGGAASGIRAAHEVIDAVRREPRE